MSLNILSRRCSDEGRDEGGSGKKWEEAGRIREDLVERTSLEGLGLSLCAVPLASLVPNFGGRSGGRREQVGRPGSDVETR